MVGQTPWAAENLWGGEVKYEISAAGYRRVCVAALVMLPFASVSYTKVKRRRAIPRVSTLAPPASAGSPGSAG